MRSKIKAMSYGLAYGLSAFGLSRQLGIPVEEARGLMDRVLRPVRRRPRLPAAASSRRPGADGYTETILGRRRYLPDLTSDNRQRREMAERMALNAPIQGSAADIIKVAMLRRGRGAARRGAAQSGCCCRSTTSWSSRSPPGSARGSRPWCADAMANAAELSVPLDVSVGIGASWHDAGH